MSSLSIWFDDLISVDILRPESLSRRAVTRRLAVLPDRTNWENCIHRKNLIWTLSRLDELWTIFIGGYCRSNSIETLNLNLNIFWFYSIIVMVYLLTH